MRRLFGKFLCAIRFHDWIWVHTIGSERYEGCSRCGKEKPELLGRTGPIA